MVSQKLIRKS